jgi:isopentenyl-diphosphate delta-isomerase type 1
VSSCPADHDAVHRSLNGAAPAEPVILLDEAGRPRATAPKLDVHGTDTPLHLGFSCHLFDRHGRVLVTRRAAIKPTWPGVWTNACCGHPQPGETLRAAVTRRLRDELGVAPRRMSLAISDFTYRAVMDNGVVEHELCPVVVADTDDDLVLNPNEVEDAAWLCWESLCDRARDRPDTLSPWSVSQIDHLASLLQFPLDWFGRDGHGLDAPFDCPPAWRSVELTSPVDPLADIRRPVEEMLTRFVSARTAELVSIDPVLGLVGEQIGDLVAAGGKRLRPAFVCWGHRATGADDDPTVVAVAAAVEMLHTFALIHDDVMDRALTRRGQPAARRSFSLAHELDGLAGDGEWFGDSAAILAGDLAFVWADDLLDAAALDGPATARVRKVFTDLRVEMMAGQFLDLRLDGDRRADPDTARRVALLKSGRYTVTRPLQLGLAVAGGDQPTQRALDTYGDAIGLAFQLRDDVLGVFGDPATTGKSATDDLRAGKRTLLMLRALALATPTQRAVLERSLGNRDLDGADADRCREIVGRTGALASIETLVRHQHAVALQAIVGLPDPARQALRALAATVVLRDR